MSYASSPKDLKEKIQTSLSNRKDSKKLPYKLNTRKADVARAKVISEWPDFDERRQHVVKRRQEVVDSLAEQHKILREKWKERGIIVHEAKNAVDANKAILAIIQKTGAKKVLKSKSMLSEEIEINDYLERAGIEPVETDLGEYIVQLRKEAPSHITMPGMHLNRKDVGELFAEKLKIPYTEDPPELTQIARKTLRKEFLQAEVGMVGVNFAVADTGHIITVTNEGNGRLVSSLPKVVIALMGYERVAQSLDDLAMLWQVLARSATGQRATVYLNMMHGPSEGPTGPEEVHVVVVDNGRKNIEADEELRDVLRCIRCGACLNTCPVYQQIGGHPYGGTYPGPIGSILTPALYGIEAAPYHPYASTLCGACEDVCPVSIPIPDLLLKLRKREVESRKKSDPEKFVWKGFAKTMETAPRYEGICNTARTLGKLVPNKSIPIPGWSKHRGAPEMASIPFRDQFESRKKSGGSDDK
jgi:L-lactate dehydrogenase complex protein LldF